ncbi:hypothetical protein OPV22_015351 [Ensete ventricosum]|uniref:ABC transporter A family member 2/9/11 C-terminal domain-containing protein n=1 Tax=Ensete ventricosum TaxID=4639 RepID=A0AAV8RCT7_ENSVE|nr:hypothetical protein OPV22_015351 [Ensete ventricosum]
MRRLEAHEGKNTKGDSVPIHFATPLRKRNRVNERKGNLEGEHFFKDVSPAFNPHLELVKHFFKDRLNVEPKEENKTFFYFHHTPQQRGASHKLQDREEEFGILDIQLGLTTLEEVFLNIAKLAELESSSTEENLVTLNLSSELQNLRILL